MEMIIIRYDDLLYDLEYKLGEIRKSKINKVKYSDKITLKEVLDLGFNRVYINGYGMYRELNAEEYTIDDYIFNNDDLLNKEVIYLSDEIFYTYDDYMSDYLEVKIDFVNKEDKELFLDYVEKLVKENEE